jgi:hypothetical protein
MAHYCKGGRIYDPYPTEKYYREVLGDPKEFGIHLEETKWRRLRRCFPAVLASDPIQTCGAPTALGDLRTTDPALTLRLRSGQARWAKVWRAYGARGAGRDGEVNSPLREEEERFLTSQADPFAGARREEEVGLLRSE